MIQKKWENENSITLKNIEEVIELIKKENITNFNLLDNYEPNKYGVTMIDSFYVEKGYEISYTDEDHLFVFTEGLRNKMLYINSTVDKKTLKKIYEAIFENQKKASFYVIHKDCFSYELLDNILNNNPDFINLVDVELNEEYLNKIKFSAISVYSTKENKRVKIGNLPLIQNKSYKDLQKEVIYITSTLSDEEIENIKYISNESNINIDFSGNINNIGSDNFKNIDNAIKIINEFKKLGKSNKIIFESNEKNYLFSKLNDIKNFDDIYVKINGNDYSVAQFVEKEKLLYQLVKDIDNNLTDFEKFIKVYDIVKNFKPYKENENDLDDSRNLYSILDNEYIVCVGFARLFHDLLSKIGIESSAYGNSVGFFEDGKINLVGHLRLLVNIKDEKYNIDGYFISDATWDNNEKNTYNNLIRPIKSMRNYKDYMTLKSEDAFLDIDDFEDYSKKINYQINKKNSYPKNIHTRKNLFFDLKEDVIIERERKIIENFLDVMVTLDNQLFKKISDLYEKIERKKGTSFLLEEILTKIGHEMVKKTNTEISNATIVRALNNIYGLNELEELDKLCVYEKKEFIDEEEYSPQRR